jgi:serine/threonine protein kinase
MAPECLEKNAADTTAAIDVWAIGIMFFSMIFGFLPFFNSNEKELIKSIRNDKVRFPSGIPITPEGKELLKAMLEKDPKKRLELL